MFVLRHLCLIFLLDVVMVDPLISSLNKRLFTIKRLKNHVNSKSILNLVDGLSTSKINYGLQLYGKVRTSTVDTKTKDLGAIQLVQNKMARFLNGKKSLANKTTITSSMSLTYSPRVKL